MIEYLQSLMELKGLIAFSILAEGGKVLEDEISELVIKPGDVIHCQIDFAQSVAKMCVVYHHISKDDKERKVRKFNFVEIF